MAGMEPLTREQVKQVLSLKDLSQRNHTLLAVGFNTGFRGSELLSLRVCDVTDTRGNVLPIVTLGASKLKGKKKSRQVKLNSDSQKQLDKLIKFLKKEGKGNRTDFLFQSRQGKKGTNLGLRQLSNIIKDVCARIGAIGRFASHTLRKSFGEEARIIYKGDIRLICDAFGHSSTAITEMYLGVRKKEVLDGMGRMFSF